MCVRLLTYDMTPDSHVTCLTILSHALHAVTRIEMGVCVSIEKCVCVWLIYDMTHDSHVTCFAVLLYSLHAVTHIETSVCITWLNSIGEINRFYEWGDSFTYETLQAARSDVYTYCVQMNHVSRAHLESLRAACSVSYVNESRHA